jgi:hypothetical protein
MLSIAVFGLSGCGGNRNLVSENSATDDFKIIHVHNKGKKAKHKKNAKRQSSSPYQCNTHRSASSFEKEVRKIALRLKSQKIYYSSRNLADCSGIYFRFIRQLQKQCHHVAMPNINKYRSSRDIAYWYYQRDQLIFIPDPLKMQHLIQPGMVVFYSDHNSRSDRFTERHIKKRRGIHHLGIIISVEKDKKGRVKSYTIFHGRSKGKYASTTTITLKDSKARRQPFGLYDLPLVAVAPLLESDILTALNR